MEMKRIGVKMVKIASVLETKEGTEKTLMTMY